MRCYEISNCSILARDFEIGLEKNLRNFRILIQLFSSYFSVEGPEFIASFVVQYQEIDRLS